MLNYEALIAQGKQAGFTEVAPLRVETIELRPEVRQMCAANTCRMYGKNWSCPPGCGTLETCEARLKQYTAGILVQTVGELEDALDGEGMMEAEARHREAFVKMHEQLSGAYANVLAIGAGTCTRCKTCTYPDAPCRFPEKMTSSMEAYGMVVSQICTNNDMKYYYGQNTIAYTSCFLIE